MMMISLCPRTLSQTGCIPLSIGSLLCLRFLKAFVPEALHFRGTIWRRCGRSLLFLLIFLDKLLVGNRKQEAGSIAFHWMAFGDNTYKLLFPFHLHHRCVRCALAQYNRYFCTGVCMHIFESDCSQLDHRHHPSPICSKILYQSGLLGEGCSWVFFEYGDNCTVINTCVI